MDVSAGGGRVQRSPQLAVERVDIRSVLDQQPRHILRVVDAALPTNSTSYKG